MCSNTLTIRFFFLGKSNDVAIKLHICLHIFFFISGLRVDVDKSYVVGVGMDSDKIQHIAMDLECQIGSFPMKYLSLPFGGMRRDIPSWNTVLGLVGSRLDSCQSKSLLLGGQVVLIKSVLSSIPIYQMSVNVSRRGLSESYMRFLATFYGVAR